MRRLLLASMLAGIAPVALLAASLHDLLVDPHSQPPLTSIVYAPDNPFVVDVIYSQVVPAGGVLSALQWWRSTPTMTVAVGTLALLLGAVIVAARRGTYTPEAIRLLRASGLLALIGGPVAVLIAALAPHWASGHWIQTALWPQALIWVLTGGGLLIVHELLLRASVMRRELAGVI